MTEMTGPLDPFAAHRSAAALAADHVTIQIPADAYPILEVSKTMLDAAPRHDVTLHFKAEAPGRCLACRAEATSVTLRDVSMSAFDLMFPTTMGPITGRLSGGRPTGYRFEPCGCELRV